MANGFQSREINPEPRSVYNGSGSDIAKGTILAYTTAPDQVAASASATGVYAGVAGEAIADGDWGRMIVRGRAQVLFSAALTIGARVNATTGGKAQAASAGESVLGIAEETGAADTLAEVELLGPSGPEMPG